MIKIFLDKAFLKQYNKLPRKIQKKFNERVVLFQGNPRNRQLAIHPLRSKKKPFISMNITGNYRALFLWKDREIVVFYEIGTHSQLYG